MAAISGPTTHPEQRAAGNRRPDAKRNMGGKATLLLVSAIVLVFTIAVGGAWAYTRFVDPPVVAPGRVLPANTLAYVTYDASPSGSQQKAFEELRRTFGAQDLSDSFREALDTFGGEVERITTSLLGEPGELSSYLGDTTTIALLPPGLDDLRTLPGGDLDQQIEALRRNLVALGDVDVSPLRGKGPLADLRKRVEEGARLDIAEKYRNIEIHSYITGTLTLYLSLLPASSTVVAATHPAPVRSVIDEFVLDTGLKYDPTYRALLNDVPRERLATLYVNLTGLSKQAGLLGGEAATLLSGQGGWMATLGAYPDGIQLNVAAHTELEGVGTLLFGSPGIDLEVSPWAKPQVASLYDVPIESTAFIVGTNLRGTALTTLDSLLSADLPDGPGLEADVRDRTGLDLREEILPLLGGDYILSLPPQDSIGEGASNALPGIVYQQKINRQDRELVLRVVLRLLNVFAPGDTEQRDEAGTRFYLPEGTSAAAAVSGDRIVLAQEDDQVQSTDRVRSTISSAGEGFGGTDIWKSISKRLPVDSNLIAYADSNALSALAGQITEGRPEHDLIRSLTSTIEYVLVGSANYPNFPTKKDTPVSKTRSHTVVFIGIRD